MTLIKQVRNKLRNRGYCELNESIMRTSQSEREISDVKAFFLFQSIK